MRLLCVKAAHQPHGAALIPIIKSELRTRFIGHALGQAGKHRIGLHRIQQLHAVNLLQTFRQAGIDYSPGKPAEVQTAPVVGIGLDSDSASELDASG